MFTDFKNVGTEVDINCACETNRESIKISIEDSTAYYRLKIHEPRSDEGYS
jgi:hypothetical protein